MAKACDIILQYIVIRTSPIKQSSICHADTVVWNSQRIRLIALLEHTEQSAHQTSNLNIDIDICVHTYLRLLNSAFPECL